jgi:hypothetical protein
MTGIHYRCHNCGSTHEVEHIRRNLYLGQRAIGTFQSYQRHGVLGVAKRLARRRVTRTLMRGLWGN